MPNKPYARELHKEGWAKFIAYLEKERGPVSAEQQPALNEIERSFERHTQALVDYLNSPRYRKDFIAATKALKQCLEENAPLFSDGNDIVAARTGRDIRQNAYYEYDTAVHTLLDNFEELRRRANLARTTSTSIMESKDIACSAQELFAICEECIAAIEPQEIAERLQPATDSPHQLAIFNALTDMIDANIRLKHSSTEVRLKLRLGAHQQEDADGVKTVKTYNGAKKAIETHAPELGIDAGKTASILNQFMAAMEKSERYNHACNYGTNFTSGRLAG
jgi:hypothetical protein